MNGIGLESRARGRARRLVNIAALSTLVMAADLLGIDMFDPAEAAPSASLTSSWADATPANFRTLDGAWSAPEAIVESGASSPELAIDSDGKAVLLWEASTPQGARLHGAYFESSVTAWQALSLTASGGPAARPVHVAAGDDGLFALVWVDGTSPKAGLYQFGDDDFLDGYARLGPARVLSTVTDVLLAGGRALAATNYASSILDVYHTEGDAFWPSAQRFASTDDGSHFAGPLLTLDGSSSARALWLQTAGPGGSSIPLTLSASTFSSSGDWSEPAVLATFDPSASVESLTSTSAENGVALVAWENRGDSASPTSPRLGLLRISADGSVDTSRPATIDTLGGVYRPAVAVSTAGDALVTWLTSTGAPDDIDASTEAWGAFQPPGESGWSEPVLLSRTDAVRARPPALAVDPSGNGHAAWVEVDTTGSARLVTSRFSGDTGFAAPTNLSSEASPATPAYANSLAADHISGPRIAVDPQGRALAVWVSATGGLWYSRFE